MLSTRICSSNLRHCPMPPSCIPCLPCVSPHCMKRPYFLQAPAPPGPPSPPCACPPIPQAPSPVHISASPRPSPLTAPPSRHLGSSSDHVLHIVRMAGAVNVRIVPGLGLVLDCGVCWGAPMCWHGCLGMRGDVGSPHTLHPQAACKCLSAYQPAWQRLPCAALMVMPRAFSSGAWRQNRQEEHEWADRTPWAEAP